MSGSQRSIRLTFEVPAPRRDELIAEVWALGTTGLEVVDEGDCDLLAVYFQESDQPSRKSLDAVARRCGASLARAEAVEPRDWLADYRAVCVPIAIGPLVIDSREPDGDAPSDSKRFLRIPARNAFGTGSHESTRLILAALVETDLVGASVLDVGTGSAILALAALRRGAARVVGFDIDIGSVVTAGDNARLNELAPALFAGTVEALGGSFDVVLVNILPHLWLDHASAIVDRLNADGEMLVSGVLAAEAETVLAPLRALGLGVTSHSAIEDWIAFRFRNTSNEAL